MAYSVPPFHNFVLFVGHSAVSDGLQAWCRGRLAEEIHVLDRLCSGTSYKALALSSMLMTSIGNKRK